VPWLVACCSIAQADPIIVTFDTSTSPDVTGFNVDFNVGGWYDGVGVPETGGSFLKFCAFDYGFGDVNGRNFTIDVKGDWATDGSAAGVGVYIYGNTNEMIWNNFTLHVADTGGFQTFIQPFDDGNWVLDGWATSVEGVLSNVTRIELMGAPTSAFSYDNVGFTPEPAILPLLCAAGFALVRKRRRT